MGNGGSVGWTNAHILFDNDEELSLTEITLYSYFCGNGYIDLEDWLTLGI